MPIDFPSNANTGDVYTEGNYSYEFTGVKWKPVNRTEYTIQTSAVNTIPGVPESSLVIDFDVNGVQYLSANAGADVVTFANSPESGEYKRVTIDIDIDSSYEDVSYMAYGAAEDFTYENVSFIINEATSVIGIDFKSDGTAMFVGDSANNEILEYQLTPAWDIESATFVDAYPIDTQYNQSPTLVNSAVGTGGTSTSGSFSINVPAGAQVGDLLIFMFSGADAGAPSVTISGFTLIRSIWSNDAYDSRTAVYYRVFQEGDSSFTCTVTADSHIRRMDVWRYVDTSNPIFASNSYVGANGASPIAFTTVGVPENSVNVVVGGCASSVPVTFVTSGNYEVTYTRTQLGGTQDTSFVYGYSRTGSFSSFTGAGGSGSDSRSSVSFSLNPLQPSASIKSFEYQESGNTLFVGVSDGSVSAIKRFGLTTPWDLIDQTENGYKTFESNLTSFTIGNSGLNAYVHNGSSLYEYTLGTAYDLTSEWTQNDTFPMPDIAGISLDGTKMFGITSASTSNIESYTMSAWDLTSASSESVGNLSEGGGVVSATFREDGYRFYTLNDTNNTVKQYLSSTVTYDILPTIAWPSNLEWENGEAPELPDLSENMQIEIEARTDYRGTNYVARLVGRNF